MRKELPGVGTHFKYYPHTRPRREPREYWEGLVARAYDEWAGWSGVEVVRLDTGELTNFSSTWWHIMIAGTWANTDLIVITTP